VIERVWLCVCVYVCVCACVFVGCFVVGLRLSSMYESGHRTGKCIEFGSSNDSTSALCDGKGCFSSSRNIVGLEIGWAQFVFLTGMCVWCACFFVSKKKFFSRCKSLNGPLMSDPRRKLCSNSTYSLYLSLSIYLSLSL